MNKTWRPYVSHKILSEFVPPVGQEHRHCDMKRGFARARKRDPQVAALLNRDNKPQRIGLLAQRGVYELHQNPDLLSQTDAVETVAERLELSQESVEVRERVRSILNNYHQNPILRGKNIIKLSRGDEGVPKPILMRQGNYQFNFFAAIDCIFVEPDGTVHVLDFKTGKSKFDKRQAYIYLLAVSYLYPQQKAIASFYNLDTGEGSDAITATPATLKAFEIELSLKAQQLQQELKRYRDNPANFSTIFPPNPGFSCSTCPFTSICNVSVLEVAA
ncbi:PD-(D/E)XK nuclease family protein [Laspinema palackyanum]|uniref:PD-(D/E)XK nuclease family protein n=1 Tax=Laspinema palackyanum TaxID=3231601 RepID=UPI00345D6B64|nr:PD-(D/E)XK nuclease family protein [Laspinema sp. D2c]